MQESCWARTYHVVLWSATHRTSVDPTTGKPKTGCGANDEFVSILARFADSANAITATTQQLLGAQYSQDCMHFVNQETLDTENTAYNSKEIIEAIAALDNGNNVMKYLRGESCGSTRCF